VLVCFSIRWVHKFASSLVGIWWCYVTSAGVTVMWLMLHATASWSPYVFAMVCILKEHREIMYGGDGNYKLQLRLKKMDDILRMIL
jgi:hypothetical protein